MPVNKSFMKKKNKQNKQQQRKVVVIDSSIDIDDDDVNTTTKPIEEQDERIYDRDDDDDIDNEEESNEQFITEHLQTTNEDNIIKKNNFDKYLFGKFYIPIKFLNEPRKDMNIREIDNVFIDTLEMSIRSNLLGYHFRNALQVNLYPIDKNIINKYSDEEYNSIKFHIDEILNNCILRNNVGNSNGDIDNNKIIYDPDKENISKKQFTDLLFNDIFHKYYKFETIGGNHSRIAFKRIINNPNGLDINTFGITLLKDNNNINKKEILLLNNAFDCQIYYNLTIENAQSIAFADNTVQSIAKEMSEIDIGFYIFRKWQDPNAIENNNVLQEEKILKKNIRLEIFQNFLSHKQENKLNINTTTTNDNDNDGELNDLIKKQKQKFLFNAIKLVNTKVRVYNTTEDIFNLIIKLLKLPAGKASLSSDTFLQYLTVYDTDNYLKAFNNYYNEISKLMNQYKINNNTSFQFIGKCKSDDEKIEREMIKKYQNISLKLKQNFISKLVTIKYNAKIALTLIDILKKDPIFKSNNSKFKYPWETWNVRKDILEYCSNNSIKLEETYIHNINIKNTLYKYRNFTIITDYKKESRDYLASQLKHLFQKELNRNLSPFKPPAPPQNINNSAGDNNINLGKRVDKINTNLPRRKRRKTIRKKHEDKEVVEEEEQEEEEEEDNELDTDNDDPTPIPPANIEYNKENNNRIISNHKFYLQDNLFDEKYSFNFIDKIIKNNIKLIIIEPIINYQLNIFKKPFEYEKLSYLLNNLFKHFPHSLIMIFQTIDMLLYIDTDLFNYNRSVKMIYWYTMINLPLNIYPITIFYNNKIPFHYKLPFNSYLLEFKLNDKNSSPINKPNELFEKLINKLYEFKNPNTNIILNIGSPNASCIIAATKKGISTISLHYDNNMLINAAEKLNSFNFTQTIVENEPTTITPPSRIQSSTKNANPPTRTINTTPAGRGSPQNSAGRGRGRGRGAPQNSTANNNTTTSTTITDRQSTNVVPPTAITTVPQITNQSDSQANTTTTPAAHTQLRPIKFPNQLPLPQPLPVPEQIENTPSQQQTINNNQ